MRPCSLVVPREEVDLPISLPVLGVRSVADKVGEIHTRCARLVALRSYRGLHSLSLAMTDKDECSAGTSADMATLVKSDSATAKSMRASEEEKKMTRSAKRQRHWLTRMLVGTLVAGTKLPSKQVVCSRAKVQTRFSSSRISSS